MKSQPNGSQATKAPAVPPKGGKRAAKRSPLSLEIEVVGQSGAFAAQTVDISKSGTLVWVTDERFAPGDKAANMVFYSERVADEFGATVQIKFGKMRIARDAEVIRLTRKGASGGGPILVAFRFANPLASEESDRLGLEKESPKAAAEAPSGSDASSTPQGATPPTSTPPVSTPPVNTPPPGPLPPAKAVRSQKSPRAPSRKAERPAGAVERRSATRIDRVLFVEIQGDYGTFKAKAFNVSQTGVLLSIDDPGFVAPSAPDQLVLFTKRMGFQFRNGMLVRFLEVDVSLPADVVRVTEHEDDEEATIVIGCKFRRPLTDEECGVLDIPIAKQEEGTTPALPPLIRGIPSAFEGRTRIRQLMTQARQVSATDLHVKVGSPPRFRIAGSLLNVGKEIFTQGESHAMALDLMSPEQARVFDAEGDAELSITLEKIGRFRVNILRQRGYTGLTIRCIPEDVPTLDSLGISPLAKTLAEKPRGIVLVTGPTGSGKSTTLAAMVDHINTTRSCHILTMEDPIEYLHTDKEAHITQREVGRDALNFTSALKRALRQDPDVILVGEMRDLETIALAITAAETGHLVFATLHTTSAVLSPDRVVDVFPPGQQTQIRMQLADSLQGVISQLLIPAIGGGVALAQEILIANDGVRALIRERKTPQIQNLMQTGAKDGMITLESSLNDLVQRGIITFENAVQKANFPKQIRRRGA